MFHLPPQPTDAELGLLDILWQRGPSTVREVFEELSNRAGKAVGYTTVLKLLQIMSEKGLVTRDESLRSHIYSAALSRESVQQSVLAKISAKLFGGSTRRLVLGALSGQPASPAELLALRNEVDALLAEHKGESKP